MVAHFGALDLEGWCELTVFDAEVSMQDRELLDLLYPGVVRVHLVDVCLDARPELCALVKRARIFAIGCGPCGARLCIDRDECAQVLAAVTDDDGFVDQRMVLHGTFEVLRRDVLATRGDDDVFLTAGDVQEAVIVEGAQVTGIQPPVNECLGSDLGLFVVAHEDVRALDQDLIVVGDFDFHPRQRRTDATEAVFVWCVEARRTRVLRLSVDLEHDDVQMREKLQHLACDRRGAGDANPRVAHADRRLELRENQLVCQLILQALVAVGRLVGFPAHLHGPLDELGLDPGCALELGRDARMKFFPNPGHAEEDGRLHLFEIIWHRFDRLSEVHL